jgi:hypothetical protein
MHESGGFVTMQGNENALIQEGISNTTTTRPQVSTSIVAVMLTMFFAMIPLAPVVIISHEVAASAFVHNHRPDPWTHDPASVVAAAVIVHGNGAIAVLLSPAVCMPTRHANSLDHDDSVYLLAVAGPRR